MGLRDRDYMHERHASGRRSTSSWRTRAAEDSSSSAWSWTRVIGTTAIVVVLLFAASNYLLERRHAQPFPETGSVHWYVQLQRPVLARLTLAAPAGVDRQFAVRLDDWETRSPVALIPVRAGETSVTLVPLGRYRMTIATGTLWQGTDRLFGGKTDFREVVYPVDFYQRGNETMGRRIELEVPYQGNMETKPGKL